MHVNTLYIVDLTRFLVIFYKKYCRKKYIIITVNKIILYLLPKNTYYLTKKYILNKYIYLLSTYFIVDFTRFLVIIY